MVRGNLSVEEALEKLAALKYALGQDCKKNKSRTFDAQYAQLIANSPWEFAPALAEKKEKDAKEAQARQGRYVVVEYKAAEKPAKEAEASYLVKPVKRATQG